MKASEIKITKQTFLINEIYDNSVLLGFERVNTSSKNANVGGTSNFFNLDGSRAYKSQLEGMGVKRVYYKGEWL